MPVPLLDVNAQNLPLESELNEAFLRVLRSGQFIMGPDVPAFESEVAKFVGAKHAIGVSSGTDAILLALMALGIGPSPIPRPNWPCWKCWETSKGSRISRV